jgi:hypothetical protein
MKTEYIKRISAILAVIIAFGTIFLSITTYAEDKIQKITNDEIQKTVPNIVDEKINKHNLETTEKISIGLQTIQIQMYDMQERLIKSDLRALTQNKSMDKLSPQEKSEFQYLMNEQKIIQEEKSKLKKIQTPN